MPRKSRMNETSSIFHVITQGLNKEYIFKENTDKEVYKKMLIKYANELNIKIFAYCIMSNHMHILIYVEELKNMSKMMHKVNLIYSKFYNEKYDRVGYVFRDRFLSEGIYSPIQLYRCILYIHNNPVKAKIVNSMNEYKYSSYNEFFNGAKNIDIELIRGIMGNMKIEEVRNMKEERFIDIKQDTGKIDELTKEFCKEKHITIKNLEENDKLKIELAHFLVVDKEKTINKVSKYLKMNRETLRKKLKKNCQENRLLDN